MRIRGGRGLLGMRRTEGQRLGYAPLSLRGQEILYVLDTWGSVIIDLTSAFQPRPVASLCLLRKVHVSGGDNMITVQL